MGTALRPHSASTSTLRAQAHVGRLAVCGEAIAIGAAATAGDTSIESIVAVNELGEIVSPCGMCRELISDYSPEAYVVIVRSGQPVSVSIMELLPDKYARLNHTGT